MCSKKAASHLVLSLNNSLAISDVSHPLQNLQLTFDTKVSGRHDSKPNSARSELDEDVTSVTNQLTQAVH
jgi:hypothetical protein